VGTAAGFVERLAVRSSKALETSNAAIWSFISLDNRPQTKISIATALRLPTFKAI
jgi:hypothetical protein